MFCDIFQRIEVMKLSDDREAFLLEYSNEDSISRYVPATAGKGIHYLLNYIYGPIYSEIINSILNHANSNKIFRVLEYGCGGGMNLFHILNLMVSKGLSIDLAVGTDFSTILLDAATKEADIFLNSELKNRVFFIPASNESLKHDLSIGLQHFRTSGPALFDLIVGVNTFRYALRLHKGQECANDIASMLAPGGYSIMIDMNCKFPFFKSEFLKFKKKRTIQTWIPSLKEYTAPFRKANLDIIQSRNFCWIPHSASTSTLIAARILSPFLNFLVPDYAMRSLVIARK